MNKPLPKVLNIYNWSDLKEWIYSFDGYEFIVAQFDSYFDDKDYIKKDEIFRLGRNSFWNILTYKLDKMAEHEDQIVKYRDWLIKELGNSENIGIIIW